MAGSGSELADVEHEVLDGNNDLGDGAPSEPVVQAGAHEGLAQGVEPRAEPATAASAANSRPAPPPPAEAHVAAGPRMPAETVVTLPARGEIRFYILGGRFQATCFRHPNCRLTRYLGKEGVSRQRAPGRGRPCGLLAAWLLDDTPGNQEDHKNALYVARMPYALRAASREHLKTVDNGPELLACERPCEPGQPEEHS